MKSFATSKTENNKQSLQTKKRKKVKPNAIKKAYNCSQQTLYAVALLALNLCLRFIDAFKLFSASYTPQFITDAIKAVEDAKKMDQVDQRDGIRSKKRIQLVAAATICLLNWKKLKRYIKKSVPKAEFENALKIAGASFYKFAAHENWNAVKSLLSAAATFITDNEAELKANNNMPDNFNHKFTDDMDNFLKLNQEYFDLDIQLSEDGKSKIEADNAIYATTLQIVQDGFEIFTSDKKVRSQFVLAYLKKIAKGTSPASLKIYFTDSNNNPVKDVSIESTEGKYSATSNAKGYARITRILATDNAEYTFVITKEGYPTTRQTITFHPGIAKTVHVEMTPVMVEENAA